MNLIVTVRRVTVILLVVLGAVTLVSGMLLYVMPKGPGSSHVAVLGLTKESWTTIHSYAGFAAAGTAVVHVYTNYRGLLFHLGVVRPRRQYGLSLHARTKSNIVKR